MFCLRSEFIIGVTHAFQFPPFYRLFHIHNHHPLHTTRALAMDFTLLASAYFYASFIPAYLLLLGIIIVLDYLAGIDIEMLFGKLRKHIKK